MSERFPGGIISKTAPVPTGPYENGTAPGIWTLEQQAEFVRQGIWPIAGNAPPYIEDVFSTWLYTGNGSSQTITNGIDLAGKGGLVWAKYRSQSSNHYLIDSARGVPQTLSSNTTAAQYSDNVVTAFNSNGFTTGSGGNANGQTMASWTFRKQPKFFDVVTYTGNGVNGRLVPHNLGSTPGCVFIKSTSAAENWGTFHRGTGTGNAWTGLSLNLSGAGSQGTPQSTVTSTSVGVTDIWGVSNSPNGFNTNGVSYVMYLFAHNAGGFGLTGTDNVISCGSYTGDGTDNYSNRIELGWEPQFILVKRASTTGNWFMVDNMRGMPVNQNNPAFLYADLSAAEGSGTPLATPYATGFSVAGGNINNSGVNVIYIAIRRGPMRTPTSGTSVLGLNKRTGTGANATVTGSAGVTDLAIIKNHLSSSNWVWASRLTNTRYLSSNLVDAEVAADTTILQANPWDVMDGVKVGSTSNLTNEINNGYINYLIDRAPGFFDVVCYTGAGAGTIAHGLGVIPEMIIVKRRSGPTFWAVYHSAIGATKYLSLNSTAAEATDGGPWNNTTPTASVFSTGGDFPTGVSGSTYVAYLFASCPGVSKVGSFTGTGATQVINCGFTGGARFVLIKATSTTGDWYVWDSARGIVAGNDPYLELNTTDAEVTNTDWVDTAASGFELSNAGGNLANSNGVSYIFLAIA